MKNQGKNPHKNVQNKTAQKKLQNHNERDKNIGNQKTGFFTERVKYVREALSETFAVYQNKYFKTGTSQIIVFGFLLIILIGTALLDLPIASANGKSIGFIDALFTSASAVCVTGLVVVDSFSHWSNFGKLVIMLLIQIGGMGFMTVVTVMFIFIGKKITLKERLIIQESFNQSDLKGMVRMVKKVFFGTFLIEGVAALILAIRFYVIPGTSVFKAIGFGIFHSVSAFCNAGFDIIGSRSLADFVGDPVVNLVVILLIVIGGIGYSIWLDVIKAAPNLFKQSPKQTFIRFTLHSKVVLSSTAILIGFGMLFFLCSEFTNPQTFGPLGFFDKLWASLFQSVSPRTAGFFTVNQNNFSYGSKFMTIILMFIGGSPGGTAGGIKTVTFSVILISVYSIVKGRDTITAFDKSIPFIYLQKSLAVVIMNLSVIIISTMILSFTELKSNFQFLDILFETTSATGTVGLTLGITSSLSQLGRLVIIVCMFIGRVGPITIAVALTEKQASTNNNIHYPEQKVLVG